MSGCRPTDILIEYNLKLKKKNDRETLVDTT